MEEFAYAEFKIDKGTASKFIGINDRFSEGGYSDRLKSEYTGIGWSKLSIMLQLPDSINEEITPEFSKSEIQQIREEVAEEQKTTPLENILEGETETTAQEDDLLKKAIIQLGESKPELYVAMFDVAKKGFSLRNVQESMAPSGENIYSVRIQGVGRLLLSAKDYEDTVSLINERTGEREKYSWNDMREAWRKIILVTEKSAEASWSRLFGKKFPEVAPVQPKKVEKVNSKPGPARKVLKAATIENVNEAPKNVNEVPKTSEYENETAKKVNETSENPTLNDFAPDIPKPEEAEEPEGQQSPEPCTENVPEETEEQLPGQISIEDMPEVLPETETDLRSREHVSLYLSMFEGCLQRAKESAYAELWESAVEELDEAKRFLKLLSAGEDDEQEQAGKSEGVFQGNASGDHAKG
jgi:hypothetical protein